MVQDEGSSSSVTSSPLHNFSAMPFQHHPSAAASPTPPPWLLKRELRSDERGLCLIHLLLNCAAAAASGRLDAANAALEHIATLASPDGDAMQRVAAAFAEALARRALRAWPGLCRALLLPRGAAPAAAELALARRHFADLCPFLRLAGAAANQSILEAMEGERIVHVVDLGGADATPQWLELLHLLAARPEGPPHLRLTAVGEHKDVLAHTAMALTKEAERLDVPFQFNPVVSRLDALDVESLRVKTGEALAITSSLQLHCLLAADDDSAGGGKDSNNNSNSKHADRRSSPESGVSPSTSRAEAFLGALWGLSPKVMVVTEQEASHNAAALTERFVEALNYYAALFDCLEVAAPRGSVERARVERWLLGEEIKNIVACDGGERRERHERLDRWAARMEAAGFGRVPLSYYALLQARRAALGLGCDGFKVREEKGCFFLCWQDRAIFSVSAWRGRRFD
ncbi:unnamed protein product [Urochloa humidicola]